LIGLFFVGIGIVRCTSRSDAAAAGNNGGSNGAGNSAQPQDSGGITDAHGIQSLWPTDASLIPPPKIFLANDHNVLSDAESPTAKGGAVVSQDSAGRFAVTVPKADKYCVYQISDTDCWAACTQSLLGQVGVVTNQKQLVQDFVPIDADDQTASLGTVIRALNPDLMGRVSQRGVIPIDLVAVTSDQMVDELLAGHFCMVGVTEERGDATAHACIVCGATFARLNSALAPLVAQNPNIPQSSSVDPHEGAALLSAIAPKYGLYSIQIFDPYPDKKGGFQTLDAQDFCDNAIFLTSRNIARETLMAALQAPAGATQPGQVVVKSRAVVNKERAAAIRAKTGGATTRTSGSGIASGKAKNNSQAGNPSTRNSAKSSNPSASANKSDGKSESKKSN
jgi:hypothetical protein